MHHNAFRRWLYSASVAAALSAVSVFTPLHAQNTGDQPATTNAAANTTRNDDKPDLGWLGLLGLVGLFGLRRRHDAHDTTVRSPRT